MITNTGKTIIGKYLLGQAPAYASHIAVGCGATPLDAAPTEGQLTEYAQKTNLDFEMFRVAISSRGFVNEDGVAKIVLTAELPTEERYEFTEVALYSAGSNPAAASNDSRTIFGFTQNEAWEQHPETGSISSIPVIAERLDSQENYDIDDREETIFQVNADNETFSSPVRAAAYERGRFYNNMVLMRGDTSFISNDSELAIESGSTHIHLTGIRADFSKNSPIDELRLAFSLINKSPIDVEPDAVRLIVEFASEDSSAETTRYAKFLVELNSEDYDFINNRYFVTTKKLQELSVSQNFAWSAVTAVRIYASAIRKFDIYDVQSVEDDTKVRLTSASNYGLAVGDKFYFYPNSNELIEPYVGMHTVVATDESSGEYKIDFESTEAISEPYSEAPVKPYIERVSDTHYIALDAMRFENIGTVSPLYGMTGYSVVSNPDASPILKNPNTNNYLEFRFSLGVQ